MYPYHNRIKQRIKAGELAGYEFVDDYPGVGECLVLRFSTVPIFRPIRPHRYADYVDLLVWWNRKGGGIDAQSNIPQDHTEPHGGRAGSAQEADSQH